MTSNEYEMLIWVLGSYTRDINVAALLLIVGSSLIYYLSSLAHDLWKYLEFRLDVDFWTETLPTIQR